MNQWITGTTGTKKITLLNEKFESVCLARISNEKSTNFSVYTPFMSLGEGREKLPKLLLEEKTLLVKDNEYLKYLSAFYTPPANRFVEL